MKAEKFPITLTERDVSAVIQKVVKLKGGKTRNYYIIEYILLGKSKQVWRSNLDVVKTVAREACIKIGNGIQSPLESRDRDRMLVSESARKGAEKNSTAELKLDAPIASKAFKEIFAAGELAAPKATAGPAAKMFLNEMLPDRGLFDGKNFKHDRRLASKSKCGVAIF